LNFCVLFNHLHLNCRENFESRKNQHYFCSFLKKKITKRPKNQLKKPSKKRLIFHQTV
jgi:hypothetical protein